MTVGRENFQIYFFEGLDLGLCLGLEVRLEVGLFRGLQIILVNGAD